MKGEEQCRRRRRRPETRRGREGTEASSSFLATTLGKLGSNGGTGGDVDPPPPTSPYSRIGRSRAAQSACALVASRFAKGGRSAPRVCSELLLTSELALLRRPFQIAAAEKGRGGASPRRFARLLPLLHAVAPPCRPDDPQRPDLSTGLLLLVVFFPSDWSDVPRTSSGRCMCAHLAS